MGWGRFLLLGDVGQQLDLRDRQRELAEMRTQMDSQWSRDGNQDAMIESLHGEIRELKLCVGSLVKLLASKQVVTQAEVEELVRVIEGTYACPRWYDAQMWQWLTESDAGLAARIAGGVIIFTILAIVDLRKRGREATRWREYLFLMFCVVFALTYGIINDWITSSISWEYFCYGKGLYPEVIPEVPPDPMKLHLAASMVGMKATWTVGLIIGVAMLMANNPRKDRPRLPYRDLAWLLLPLAGIAISFAILLGAAGNLGWLAWISSGFEDLVRLDAMRPTRFMTVYGIHLGGYVGGLIGTIMAVVIVMKRRNQGSGVQKA